MTFLDILPSRRSAVVPRVDPTLWPRTTDVDKAGRLTVGGVALADIADQVGTPAYVIDEADFRYRARRYRKELPGTKVVYAGPALLTTAVARWAADEHLGVDVCSAAELATVLAGGVAPARVVYHGAAQPWPALEAAMAVGVGCLVVDSGVELPHPAGRTRPPQNVLIRVDGSRRELAAAVARIAGQPMLRLVGLHCHIGSQVCIAGDYGDAVHRMIAAMADVRRSHRMVLGELNIGGGHGVPYASGDPELDLAEFAACVDDALDTACAAERFPRPTIVVEPGRALSARAGVTLYRVGSVQSLPAGRTVAVDGAAPLGARYTATLANRRSLEPADLMNVGPLGAEMELPADTRPGDLIAVACTGAYQPCHQSSGRPPLVAVCDGKLHTLVRRETIADPPTRDLGRQRVTPGRDSTRFSATG